MNALLFTPNVLVGGNALSGPAFQNTFATYGSVASPEGSIAIGICLNEVYPDPGVDTNGDGTVDQNDEFIELYNPSSENMDLSGFIISDNTGPFSVEGMSIGPNCHLALFRCETGLVLSNDDVVTLQGPDGALLDQMDYPYLKKGWVLQRAPDGSERTRTGRFPTPGSPNVVPSIVINEVMPDPVGSNQGKQWAELLNKGPVEEVEGMVLSNNEAVSFTLPRCELGTGERLIVAFGGEEGLSPHPESTNVVEAGLGAALYSSGDDLEVFDRDGTSLDYLAWGSSVHIGGPKGRSDGPAWDGKIWDAANGTMSEVGELNPATQTGISLARCPDGSDHNSTDDLFHHPGSLGQSSGWDNSMDPLVQFESAPVTVEFAEGERKGIEISLLTPLWTGGTVSVAFRVQGENWTLTSPDNLTIDVTGPECVRLAFDVMSPIKMTECHEGMIMVEAFYLGWGFIRSELGLRMLIPSMDLLLSDLYCTLEGVHQEEVPGGALLDVGGKLCVGGEVSCPQAMVSISLFERSTGNPYPGQAGFEVAFKDLKVGSRRSFGTVVDTRGCGGAAIILVEVDPYGLVEESSERNNIATWQIEIVQPPVSRGESGIMITDVLWNTTLDGTLVRIGNSGDEHADVSSFHLETGGRSAMFPMDCHLGPAEGIFISWGEAGIGRVWAGERVLRMDGKGPISERMKVTQGLPDPAGSGGLMLSSKWRTPLDEVVLTVNAGSSSGCRSLGSGVPETTSGTVLHRVRDIEGLPIDTNSTLDWSVMQIEAALKAILIAPAPSSAGEFIVLEGAGGTDLSGALISCNGRISVVPNGTFSGPNGLLTISGDETRFLDVEGYCPDLVLGWDTTVGGEPVKGCRLPGEGELILPNDRGELVLKDGANRVLDRLCWGDNGSSSIGQAPPDTVIWRHESVEGVTGPWSALCLGSCPAYNLMGMPCSKTGVELIVGEKVLEGTYQVPRNVKVVAPFLKEGTLFDELRNLLQAGADLEVFLGCEPWDCDVLSGFQTADPSVALSCASELASMGSKIFTVEDGYDPEVFPTMVALEGGTVLIEQSILSPNGGTEWSAVGLRSIEEAESSPHLLKEILSLTRDAIDITDLLSRFPAEQVGIADGGNSSSNPLVELISDGAPVELRNCLDPLGTDRGEVLWAMHREGALDMASFLDIAKEGAPVRLMIDPGHVHPSRPPGAAGPCMVQDISGHCLDLEALEEDVLEHCLSAVQYAKEEGADIEVRILPVGQGFGSWSNIQFNGSHLQFDLPALVHDGKGGSLRIPCDRQEWLKDRAMGLWELSSGLPTEMGWGRVPSTPVDGCSGVRIEEVYPDTYLADDPDEYISLLCTGDFPVDVSGWTVSDDAGSGHATDGTIMLPKGTIVGPGHPMVIARDYGRFNCQNGRPPDLAMWNCSLEEMVLATEGDLRLSNSGDSIALRDSTGRIVDIVLYGITTGFPDGNGCYRTGEWSGEPAPLPGWGHVLFREVRRYGELPEDTNSREDWMSIRPRYPGQSRFSPWSTPEVVSSMVGICPDSGSSVLSSLISNTSERLDVNVYELSSCWITSALVGASDRGVRVRVLMEGNPVGGLTEGSLGCAYELLGAGVEVRYMVTDPSAGVRDRYRYDHAKYMVSDGGSVLVSSDNFKDTSFPGPLVEGKCSGARGWVVVLESSEMAGQLGSVFDEDWSGPDMVKGPIVVGDRGRERGMTPSTNSLQGEGTVTFGTAFVEMPSTAQLLIAPDQLSVEGNPLLEAISCASEEILLEAMTMDLDYLVSTKGVNDTPSPSERFLPDVERPNPYVSALLGAARRGVKVKVLLDGSDFDCDAVPDNLDVLEGLRSAALLLGVDKGFEVRLHPPDRPDLDRRVLFVHNKGIIIDSGTLWISSFNFGPTSGLENREVGVLLKSKYLSDHLRKAFLFDWGGSLLGEVHITGLRYGFSRDGRENGPYIEMGIDTRPGIEGGLGVVAVPSEGWDPSSPNPPEGAFASISNISGLTVVLSLSSIGAAPGTEIDIIVCAPGRWAHILRFTMDEYGDDSALLGLEWYRSGYIPILGIVAAATAFCAITGYVKDRDRGRRRLNARSDREE